MSEKRVNLCETTSRPIIGGAESCLTHDIKKYCAPRGATIAGTRRKKSVSIGGSLTPEQQTRKAQQDAINKSVDSAYSVTLEAKLYQPGTPEFNDIAEIYIRREKSISSGIMSRTALLGADQREKNKVAGVRASWGSLQR